MSKKWISRQCPPESVRQLARDLRISEITARTLVNRGLVDARRAREFLEPSLHALSDPCEHPALKSAAEFLHDVMAAGRRITVFGDYDADGICATALLVNCFRAAGADVDFHIPHRIEDGYGLNCRALEQIRARGTEVIVTVDCGISAREEVAHAADLGLELVITDHHEPGRKRTAARHVLNPHLPECGFGYEHLAGVGVAFKLAWALGRRLAGGGNVPESYRELLMEALPLVAIGTIADVVPLAEENRTMAHFGLRLLSKSRNLGIQALLRVAGAEGKSSLGTYHVAFQLAPRLNAAGRMAHAQAAVDMLTTTHPGRAEELAEHLEQQNRRRQSLQRATTEEARQRVETAVDLDRSGCIVLSSPTWHPGVAGLVASRLAETFWRPTFIFCEESGLARGSGRSIPGFHLFEAVSKCEDLVDRFGGHEGAAGVTLPSENLGPFTERMSEIAWELFGSQPPTPHLDLEGAVQLADISLPVVEELQRLAPFGTGNPEPVFLARQLRLAGNPQLVGSKRSHLSFLTRQGDVTLRVIAFGKADWLPELRERRQELFALAFAPTINTFTGQRRVELRAEDLQWEPEPVLQTRPT